MAACGDLEPVFEKPLPETPTFLEPISSRTQIKSMKHLDHSSFTETLAESHFKEDHVHRDPPESSPPFSSWPPSSSYSSNLMFSANPNPTPLACGILKNEEIGGLTNHQENNGSSSTSNYWPCDLTKQHRHSDSFSSMNSDGLSMCTEGLGSESCDDIEDVLRMDICNSGWPVQEDTTDLTTKAPAENENQCGEPKRSRTSLRSFPPPISSIGRSGRPWLRFRSFREDGRFTLKEIRIPTRELLHSCREQGRLKLKFIQSDDEILDDEEEEEEDAKEKEDAGNDSIGGKQELDRNREGEEEKEKKIYKRTSNCSIVYGRS